MAIYHHWLKYEGPLSLQGNHLPILQPEGSKPEKAGWKQRIFLHAQEDQCEDRSAPCIVLKKAHSQIFFSGNKQYENRSMSFHAFYYPSNISTAEASTKNSVTSKAGSLPSFLLLLYPLNCPSIPEHICNRTLQYTDFFFNPNFTPLDFSTKTILLIYSTTPNV